MGDVTIKKEKVIIDDYSIDDTLSEINEILEEVKREENASSDEEGPRPSATAPVTEACIEELFKDESENSSEESVENAEIQRLQELLERRKRELKESTGVQSGSPSDRRKRKGIHKERPHTKDADHRIKRKCANESLPHGSGSPVCDGRQPQPTSTELPNEDIDKQKSQSVDAFTNSSNNKQPLNESSVWTDVPVPATEIEQLLKTDDYNSDGEGQSHEGMPTTSFAQQPPYVFPPAIQMGGTIYGAGSQMMGNYQAGDYPLIYNMGFQAPFYPNMGNMPMMGYGLPQMNLPVNQDEVECLPVVNEAGFSGMPTFKRIKLERNLPRSSESDGKSIGESPEDRRIKVFETCTTLLEHLEFAEPTGKFTHTSTVTKLNRDSVSNSIIQKISNVSYEFHSIGPQLNLANWGLKEISSRNADIAKKIAMSAEKYFAKIAEKANSMARQLIKVEDAKADRKQDELEIEIEEPTLSTFLKNSMTQTEPLICRDCVARKRIVGHEIGVQATVYTGSIGSQTSPIVSESDRLSAGLNSNQLKALFEFSFLIREPSKNTSIELLKLREKLMDVYNLSQRPNIGPVPNIPSLVDSSAITAESHLRSNIPTRDPRYDNSSPSDSRRFMPPGMPNQRHLTSPMQAQIPSAVKLPHYQPNSMQSSRFQRPVVSYPGYSSTHTDPRYSPAPQQDVRSYGRGTPRQ